MLTSKTKGKLYLIRGLPGSGKTTLAKVLQPNFQFRCSADDYFTNNKGEYLFDPEKLPQAHEACRLKVSMAMENKAFRIVVHNTFSQPWESAPYFDLAEKYGYSVFVIECQNKFQRPFGMVFSREKHS